MPERYESHYLRAVDPARPRGAWIRHTTHEARGGERSGALWCTAWDAEAGPPYAVKQPLPFAGPPPAPLPRTKPESPLPDAVCTGWLEAGPTSRPLPRSRNAFELYSTRPTTGRGAAVP